MLRNSLRRSWLILATLIVPVTVYAQAFPSQNITLPAFVIPASGVNGGGVMSTPCLTFPLGTPLCEDAVNVLDQRNSTTAQRLNVANTFTSTISYEVFSVDWQTTANVGVVGCRTAATGTNRACRFVSQASSGSDNYVVANLSHTAPFVRLDHSSLALGALNDTSTGNFFQIGGALTSTATSGPNAFLALLPMYNQASGTAANTDFLVNRTPTAVGSGTQLLADFQNNSVSKWSVSNLGTETTTQTTLGTNVQILQTTATNDDPVENVRQQRAATTDATPATIDTITIPVTTTVLISCMVVNRRTGGVSGTAEDGAGYRVEVVMKNVAGTATEIAAETVTTIGESIAGYNVTAAPTGATELIQVTGAATTNITWHSTCRTYLVGS